MSALLRLLAVLAVIATLAAAATATLPDYSAVNKGRVGLDNDTAVFPLSGGITAVGAFYLELELGTPQRTFRLQIDTGSSDLLVYAENCTTCGSTDGVYFSVDESKTSDFVTCAANCQYCTDYLCGFDLSYSGGDNVTGVVVRDDFQLDTLPGNTEFGLIYYSKFSPFEAPGVDGIIGLAYPSLSDWYGAGVLYDLFNHGIPAVFSMCLTKIDPVMSVGVVFPEADYVWTPVTHREWYAVELLDVRVNNVSLGIPSTIYNDGLCNVDSGTTLFLLPHVAFVKVLSLIQDQCATTDLVGVCNVAHPSQSLLNGFCPTMTADDIAAFPNITLSLDGASQEILVSPESYLVNNPGTAADYCLGIEDNGVGVGSVLGDVVMQGYHVVFDVANNRVGFGDLKSCPRPD